MAQPDTWHVVPSIDRPGWKLVRGDDWSDPESEHRTKDEAIAAANHLGAADDARGRVLVHDEHGEIESDWSFGEEGERRIS